jgi:two-component system, chemotaxis family, protein-glutamate methylesterase/glutaminase
MSIAVAATSRAPATARPIRVMVVDDAVVARSLVVRWVDAEPDMAIAASLRTGREAVDQIERSDPDVVVLDIEMPELDGISALPQLLKKKRDVAVIMASSLTRRGAEISMRALALGAADYIPKPASSGDAATSSAFRRELIEKIRHLARRRSGRPHQFGPAVAVTPGVLLRAAAAMPAHGAFAPADASLHLRPFPAMPPRVLLIGSSTGGPQALTALMRQLGPLSDRVPVLITQHMPATFTTVLAEHLARVSGRRVREAVHGEAVTPGTVYVAPGGRHMRVAGSAADATIALGDDAPVNYCRPAVDPFFTSAAAVWGANALALVLTGMGSDGTQGAADLVAAGGCVIAQDEATSVVWGMPRSVALGGLCSAVLALDDIAPKVIRLFVGGRA